MLKFQALRKGGLVSLQAQPRLGAKKFVYVIGGSHRELGSAWTHSEFTYDSVEMFDIYNKCWHQVRPQKVAFIFRGPFASRALDNVIWVAKLFLGQLR